MLTFEVSSASDVAQSVSERLPQNTSQTALKLYRVLVEVGVEVTQRRGHSPGTCEVVFHLPLELVAAAVGLSRVTVWRYLPELKHLGVVDHRPHKASCRGMTRNSGTVWRVRLTPRRGSKARVSVDDLRHLWRGRDMRGAASYQALQHTKNLRDRSLKIKALISWALSPISTSPVTSVCFSSHKPSLEVLLGLTGVGRDDRRGAVDTAAQAVATALRDASSLNWYRRLLWQLLRRYDATSQDESYRVFIAAQRAAVDAREWSGLRRPGALLVSRLRTAPWFDEMMNGPPIRVGSKPTPT